MTVKDNYVKRGWKKIKDRISSIETIISIKDVISLLKSGDYYKQFFGKSKNRTMIRDNPSLYKSIYHHTEELERAFRSQNSYKGNYNFKYRILFIVDKNCNLQSLRCKCGRRYTWNTYCRQCPEYHKTWNGRKHTCDTKKKQRLSAIKYIKNLTGKVSPRYNKSSIKIIEDYGNKHGYTFQHAENGGEYYIKELGYFLDAYDKKKNVVLEIDESHHFNLDKLKDDDLVRQLEIENHLKCKFIRIRV